MCIRDSSLITKEDKNTEFIYILYFLLRKIFYASYPLQKPQINTKLSEDEENGINIMKIFMNNQTHFTKSQTGLSLKLKFQDISLYNTSREKTLLHIFLAIILKKHRDIFSNLWLCHKNIIKHIYRKLTACLTLYIWNFGTKTQNIKESNHVGFFSTTDFNIVKNIYGNFLSNYNILEFLTSLCVSFTISLPHNDFTFNNIPWVDDVEKAFKLDGEMGDWPSIQEIHKINVPYYFKPTVFSTRLDALFKAHFSNFSNMEEFCNPSQTILNFHNFSHEKKKEWDKNKVNLLGWHNPEHWTYNKDAIKDYDIILQFFNSELFNKLLGHYQDEMPTWRTIPEYPKWFIIDDNSMWLSLIHI